MHVDAAMGVVCAAPTGGSAGVIPGTLVTLEEEKSIEPEVMARALLAAGAIGMILAIRGTFAAEVARCRGDWGLRRDGSCSSRGRLRWICPKSMRCSCDLFSKYHGNGLRFTTRNGGDSLSYPNGAAASAFVNADLVMGGYPNLIPLDETIDAVYAVGLAMPSELRCTSKGGLAVTPSAQALQPGCCGSGCAGCG